MGGSGEGIREQERERVQGEEGTRWCIHMYCTICYVHMCTLYVLASGLEHMLGDCHGVGGLTKHGPPTCCLND